MNSLTRSTDNPDLYGVPEFFLEFINNPKENDKPEVQEANNEASLPDIKIPYTDAELQFIVFAKEYFKPVRQEGVLTTLSSTKVRQTEFNQWLAQSGLANTFKPDELNINILIASVWRKSRNNVLVQLKDYGTTSIIKDEHKKQNEALVLENENQELDQTVKIFTNRQLRSLYPQNSVKYKAKL